MLACKNKRPAVAGRALFILVAALGQLLPANASSGNLRQIGTIPFGADFSDAPFMIVDSMLHRGYSQAVTSEGIKLMVYDLENLRISNSITLPFFVNMRGAAVDEIQHRIFFPIASTTSSSCQVPTSSLSIILVFDQITQTLTEKRIECLGETEFTVRYLSYDASSRKLYAAGIPSSEELTEGNHPNNRSVRFRQMDPETMAVEWNLDAGSVCDNANNRLVGMTLARAGNSILSYCYRNGLSGYQGLALRIPLDENDQLVIDPQTGDPFIFTGSTLPGPVAPLFDETSGRMVIFTEGAPNGQAAWVYDPGNDRFFGVIPSGTPQPPLASLFLGLDKKIGRAYILNSRGIVIADFRHNPLPGGVSYPVLDDLRDNNSGPFIAVDTNLRRLFVPRIGKGFMVIQDEVAEPIDPPAPDPDRGTADIAHVAGKTEVAFGSAASAFGIHILNTGGAPRAVNNLDPACNDVPLLSDKDSRGRCPADVVLAPGNREYMLSQGISELGSDSGVSAFAAAGRSPSSDSATDADLRSISVCESDKFPDPAGTAMRDQCPSQGPLQAFSNGTRGEDEKGFPVPGSFCTDFQRIATQDSQPGPELGTSSVHCDYAKYEASTIAHSSGVAVAGVSIGYSESTITTTLTAKGLVTTADAIVRDIDIGGLLRIGEVHTTSVTRAGGTTGTTIADFTREISQVSGLIACDVCKPEDVADAINRLFSPSIRARLPEARELASPKGYQGIVSKDPLLKDSDRAVNDDDTDTVNGLDIIFYNDGSQGRSRLIIGLAGVQTEARFGIFPLPQEQASDPDPLGAVLDVFFEPTTIDENRDSTKETAVPKAQGRPVASPLPIDDAIRLIVNNPREFGILFLLWTLLGAPVYLGLRRRSLVKALP